VVNIKLTLLLHTISTSISYYVGRFINRNNIQKKYVSINDIQLYYEIIGSDDAIPLVFLHGGSAFIDSFMAQLPFFSRKEGSSSYKIIAVESRGHGKSTDSGLPFSYALMASDTLALLDYLHVPKCSIVGWSDGGIIGLELAMHHPERVNKLVLVGTNYNLEGLVPMFQEDLKHASAKHWLDRSAVLVYNRKSKHKKPKPNPDIFIKKIANMWLTEPNYSDDQIRNIKCPTLVMTGQDEEYILENHTRKLSELIQNSQLVFIPKSGHECLMEQSKISNRVIDQFLCKN
jgi:pimeloyl-ACP methyl ester carboxylesterase